MALGHTWSLSLPTFGALHRNPIEQLVRTTKQKCHFLSRQSRHLESAWATNPELLPEKHSEDVVSRDVSLIELPEQELPVIFDRPQRHAPGTVIID